MNQDEKPYHLGVPLGIHLIRVVFYWAIAIGFIYHAPSYGLTWWQVALLWILAVYDLFWLVKKICRRYPWY